MTAGVGPASTARAGTASARGLSRRRLGQVMTGGLATLAVSAAASAADDVNAPRAYRTVRSDRVLDCLVATRSDRGRIDRRVFGTNLEWFNEAGGLASADPARRAHLAALARDQGVTVLRFPGGTLSDYYHWQDGTGPVAARPVRRHPTDRGSSPNSFGSPEFFRLLKETGAQGLITLNVGTGSAQEAAAWVAYANQPGNAARRADGFPDPIGIKLWEVGNEVYYSGGPDEQPIGQTPEVYARNFVAFADAIRQVDPHASVMAIGTARSHIGPDTPFGDWTQTLLAAAAPKIDMIAVHNAYFPFLADASHPTVDRVYPALWAAPEAVDRSLTALSALIERHEAGRRIGIAVTEWGALFSVPQRDRFWFDHVKTIGSGVYVARLLQVLLGQPRVAVANYFKLTDRSFMGWIGFDGRPKVPYWVFRLFAQTTGDTRLQAAIENAPTYDTPGIGNIGPERGVPEVTVLATAKADGTVFVNLVNRSLTSAHKVRVRLDDGRSSALRGTAHTIAASEPTAHEGNDSPPEEPSEARYEPYSTAPPGSIAIRTRPLEGNRVELAPFSVTTLVLLAPDKPR